MQLYSNLVTHRIVLDGIIKRKGRGYSVNLVTPVTSTNKQREESPPANYQTPSPLVHSLAGSIASGAADFHPPDAPRKSTAKLAYLQQQASQESMEDIEDSFQDTTTSPPGQKLPVHGGYQQPALQLKRGRDEPVFVTGCIEAVNNREVGL